MSILQRGGRQGHAPRHAPRHEEYAPPEATATVKPGLHVAPESAAGGPLVLVRDGDEIELDVPKRTLTLRVSDEELARRRAAWTPRPAHFERG